MTDYKFRALSLFPHTLTLRINLTSPTHFFFSPEDILRTYLLIFRERGREGEKGGDKHQLVASHTRPPGDQTHNLGMCPAGYQTRDLSIYRMLQPTELHWLGLQKHFNHLLRTY